MDDTARLQAAVDAAVANGRAVTIHGHLRVTRPIRLPSGRPVTIRAATESDNGFGPITPDATIEADSTDCFTSTDGGSVHLRMTGVNLRATGTPGALFADMPLKGAIIRDVTATNFDKILKNSPLRSVSRIESSRFQRTHTAFSDSDVVDAIIGPGNYIDGTIDSNPTAFTGMWATSVLIGNYVDFWKRVFDVPWVSDLRAVGNMFDYCWNVAGTSRATPYGGLTFTGNTIHHCRAEMALPNLLNPDRDMTSRPWTPFDFSAGVQRSTFTGNLFLAADVAFRYRGHSVFGIRSTGNTYDPDVTRRIDYELTPGGVDTGTDMHLEEMQDQRVDTLPSASLTSGPIHSYDRHRIVHDGRPLWNDAGVWRDMLGDPA